MVDIEKMAAQLDELIHQANELSRQRDWDEVSAKILEGDALSNRLESAIERIAPPGSSYLKQLAAVRGDRAAKVYPSTRLRSLCAVAVGLREDIRDGWAKSVVELVHAEMYSSYLEMSVALLENGFKDAAAVITGTSLEVHVRELCAKNGVDVEVDSKPKKADTMNADLKKAGVYGTLQQKQVTAWMDLRNKAAHGHYGDYDYAEVRAFIRGVREFMLKYPA
ncbi:hypothetical protein [Streptomyces ossamyceticus]|uniref:hypothetical protein n=1 Tax=Streptomyces ossamyceticus TaxID=249581 RepID=UPI000A946655|nr:hypothetical protein [Streptomyces ossamyceticus]